MPSALCRQAIIESRHCSTSVNRQPPDQACWPSSDALSARLEERWNTR